MSIETEAPHQWAAEEVAYANEGQMSNDRDLEERAIKRDTSERGFTAEVSALRLWRGVDALGIFLFFFIFARRVAALLTKLPPNTQPF